MKKLFVLLFALSSAAYGQVNSGPVSGGTVCTGCVPTTSALPVTLEYDDTFFVNVAGGTPAEFAVNNGTIEAFVSDTFYVDAAGGNDELIISDGATQMAGKVVFTPQSATCNDSGNGSLSTLTLNPLAGVVHLTNSDADGCTVTLSETNAVSGTVARIVVISNAGGTANFADTSGVTEIATAFSAAIYDSITLEYAVNTWVELARSNN